MLKRSVIHSLLASLLVLGGCAPTITSVNSYDPSQGARHFTVTVDGEAVQAQSGGAFVFSTGSYELQLQIDTWRIPFTLLNSSNSSIRLVWDEAAFVYPDGESSRVVSGTTSYDSRNQPIASSIVPPRAKLDDAFYPIGKSYWNSNSGWTLPPYFSYPLESATTFRLYVPIQMDGVITTHEVVFEGRPD